jgi:pyrroline-5-carboxylate reductase
MSTGDGFRLAFLGGGNMAAALLSGLQRDPASAPAQTWVVEPDARRRAELETAFGVVALAEPGAALAAADLTVLAVKPQHARTACAQFAAATPVADRLVLSIAAGIRIRDLARWLPGARLVRAMPNTPALIGAGITGLAAAAAVTPAERALATRVVEACGQALWFDDEAMLDAVTAVSGSGPAYVFYFIEALQRAAEDLGVTPEAALSLALATFSGASRLAAESGEAPGVLRERVTSKGGTTAAALAVLASHAVADQLLDAVRAAQRRAVELGDEFGDDST